MQLLREEEFCRVITNTVVSGKYVPLLKQYGFFIVSLIHEMKTTIELYGFLSPGESIAYYSDYIVFPDYSVQKGFETLFPVIRGKCSIRPQGVYMQVDEEEDSKFSFEEYGFSLDQKIVMCSGTCELRKGTDLFVSAAQILSRKEKQRKSTLYGQENFRIRFWKDGFIIRFVNRTWKEKFILFRLLKINKNIMNC